MNGKPWYLSKTLIANAVALLASVAAGFGVDIGPDVQAELVAGVMAAVNIGLRFATREPVTAGKEQ